MPESKMALTLTEEEVRNRVRLTHDKCEDVKSISLPGTYHEKIVSLGNGLRKFTRLKSLDLSRNALESLEGVENLEMLEKLNLYYNNISSLEELKRLRQTAKLKELDLRLNPVTRSEPDYRLFLIHMLPDLQKLDDRGVRDRERQAALIHFSSSQATEMTHHPPRKEPAQKPPHPRAEFTHKLGKPPVLDNDDVAMLDMVAMKDGDLSRPRPLTGSSAKEPAMEEYSLEVLKNMSLMDDTGRNMPQMEKKRPSSLPPPKNEDRMSASYREKYPNIANLAMDDVQDRIRNDPNLKYQDELDAYSKYKSHGYFTPNPASDGEITIDRLPPQSRPKESGSQAPREVTQVPTERGAYLDLPRWERERDGDTERDLHRDSERDLQRNSERDLQRNAERDLRRETERELRRETERELRKDREREEGRGKRREKEGEREVKKLGDGGEAEGQSAAGRHRRTRSVPEAETFPTERALPDPTQNYHQSLRPSSHRYDASVVQSRLDENQPSKKMLFKILDLVDRYWNGSKSLHQHAKFLSLALDEVDHLQKDDRQVAGGQSDVNSLRHRMERLQEENSYLRDRQRRVDADSTTMSGGEAQLKKSLQEARDDLDNLREELKAYVKENSRLQRKLDQQTSATSYSGVSAAPSSSNTLHLDDLQRQNEALSREIEGLRSRLKQYAQMQELASMLQESHKSLVQTNEHLLKDTEEERRRHKREVEQMHFSFEQLKKTMSYLPSTIKGDSTLNINANNTASYAYRDGDR